MVTTKSRKILLLAVTLSLLPGCASRPEPSHAQCIANNPGSIAGVAAADHDFSTVLERPHARILALSGGGKWGAFGAGYLTGWHAAAGRLPEFDIVTGVSTGAILATPAFIGDPSALAIYRKISDSDIVALKFPPFSFFSAGLASSAPLRKVVENMVGEQELLAVAQRARTGAALLVGAVNLDNGEFVDINLGAIAMAFASEHSKNKRSAIRRRYIDAIVASATVPLAMEPVYLDCAMMVDGGVRHQVFLPESMYLLPTARAESEHARPDDSPTVFVIINGLARSNFVGLGVGEGAELAKPNLADIGRRSVAAMLDSSLDSDIARICSLSNELRISIIAADQAPTDEQERCENRDDGSFFSQPFMACLYEMGLQQGRFYQGSQSPHGLSCPSEKDH